jgi:hypothetical protein
MASEDDGDPCQTSDLDDALDGLGKKPVASWTGKAKRP